MCSVSSAFITRSVSAMGLDSRQDHLAVASRFVGFEAENGHAFGVAGASQVHDRS